MPRRENQKAKRRARKNAKRLEGKLSTSQAASTAAKATDTSTVATPDGSNVANPTTGAPSATPTTTVDDSAAPVAYVSLNHISGVSTALAEVARAAAQLKPKEQWALILELAPAAKTSSEVIKEIKKLKKQDHRLKLESKGQRELLKGVKKQWEGERARIRSWGAFMERDVKSVNDYQVEVFEQLANLNAAMYDILQRSGQGHFYNHERQEVQEWTRRV
ncbi:hypothetical protein OQA88_11080 [Cercophora sp. LCS_1]